MSKEESFKENTEQEEEAKAGAEEAGAEEAQSKEAQSEEAALGAEEGAEDVTEEEESESDPEEASPEEDKGEGKGDAEEESDGKKSSIFSRREKKALAKKDEEIAALKDRYMRTLAEYENFRKRTEKEKADLYSYAVKDVMTKILPVLDNLERGLAALPEDSRKDAVAEGMDKICKQFVKALDDLGVKPIPAEGEPFDPNLHNAVMHVEDESYGENVVAEELQKGYTYRDSVVRHSMVKVAN